MVDLKCLNGTKLVLKHTNNNYKICLTLFRCTLKNTIQLQKNKSVLYPFTRLV